MKNIREHILSGVALLLGLLAMPLFSGCVAFDDSASLTCDSASCINCLEGDEIALGKEPPLPPIDMMAQRTIEPTHSRFHPVPTRPVFAPRVAMLPPDLDTILPPEPESIYLHPSSPLEMEMPDSLPPTEAPHEEILPLPVESPQALNAAEDSVPLQGPVELEPVEEIPLPLPNEGGEKDRAALLPESANLFSSNSSEKIIQFEELISEEETIESEEPIQSPALEGPELIELAPPVERVNSQPEPPANPPSQWVPRS